VNTPAAYAAFDLLATLVAVARPNGEVLHANASFENLLGVPRRALIGTALSDWLVDPVPLRETMAAVADNRIATGRFEAMIRRPTALPAELRSITRPIAAKDYWTRTPLRQWITTAVFNAVYVDRERKGDEDPLQPLVDALASGDSKSTTFSRRTAMSERCASSSRSRVSTSRQGPHQSA